MPIWCRVKRCRRRCIAAAAGLLLLAPVGSTVLQSPWLQSAAGALLLLTFGFVAWTWLLEGEDRATLESLFIRFGGGRISHL
jgi:hypothetical protein